MECKKIREFILSDYSDGEAPEDLKKEIEGHLGSCPACKKFQGRAFADCIEPFKNTVPAQPPEPVWDAIRETIMRQEEQQALSLVARVSQFIDRVLPLRKPVVALTGVIAVVLLMFVFVKPPSNKLDPAVNAYLREQEAFMVSLNTAGGTSVDQEVSLGTAIEAYLL